jgi:hypothetical protein
MAQGYRHNFDPSALQDRVNSRAARAVEKAAIYLEGKIKEKISVQGPPSKKVKARQRRARFARAERLGVTLRHSRPGEPPRVVTGMLLSSISHEPVGDGLRQRVGTDVTAIQRLGGSPKYGFWLEMGTLKMAPRPYLRSTLREEQAEVSRIIKEALRD